MFHITTKNQLKEARKAVKRELKGVGLYHPKFSSVRVRRSFSMWLFTPTASAHFISDDDGAHICFAGITLHEPDLLDLFRHEYGHALMHFEPELFGGYFYEIFGKEPFLTDYARTNEEEDFCETMAFYIRMLLQGGSCWWDNEGFMEKWQFIEHLTRIL